MRGAAAHAAAYSVAVVGLRGRFALYQRVAEPAVDEQRGESLEDEHGAHEAEVVLRQFARQHYACDGI